MSVQFFVENQTSMASATFLDTVEGWENVLIDFWKKCLKLTPERAKMVKSMLIVNPLSKADSNRARALIRHNFPKNFNMDTHLHITCPFEECREGGMRGEWWRCPSINL
jgi:hypothetical protein